MKGTYALFTTKELKPQGWLRRQLLLQAQGLAGNLDKVWPDVRDSKWVGGDREGWERVPYWLDGFIPLAYLLDDEDMKARAKRYIDKILEIQKEDGWICPTGDDSIEWYDTWAVQLITKVLTVYYECSGDERIPEVLRRAMKNYYELLSAGTIKLYNWGKFRWYESFVALNRLAEWYPEEEWIPALAHLLKEQGADYASFTERWKHPLNIWKFETHIVNLMMMLKYEAISCDLLGEKYTDIAESLYSVLKKYNGMAAGCITGDECLAGLSPIHGSELCSVVEQMYSYECLYAYTGDRKWAERLERLAFNALPATITEDMWGHQYVQMTNQIDCTCLEGYAKVPFGTNGKEAHVFGLEPNFGCCTANFGQGWPKLALSAFMKAKDGVVSAVPIPSELSIEWNGVPVTVTLSTEYPFRNTFTYRIAAEKATNMALRIRIPSFAKNLKVNGEAVAKRGMLLFRGFCEGVTELTVSFETEAVLKASPNGMYMAEKGSLLFAVPIESEVRTVEYEKNDVERKFPYCDYYMRPVSDWNYAFTDRTLSVQEQEVDSIPFSEKKPAVTVRARLCHIDWGYEDGFETVCAKKPLKRKPLDASAEVTLIPYGCAKLRMTELPLVKPQE